MKLIQYISGLIGAIVTAVIVVFINQLTGWEIHSLNILFIIPIGGIILGIVGASGFFFGKKFANAKTSKLDYVIAIFLGLLTFFSVNYISYTNTYISRDSGSEASILYQFSQPTDYVSLSTYMSFGEYMNEKTSSSANQLAGVEFETGETATTILFYVQILGVLFGSLMLALAIVNSKKN